MTRPADSRDLLRVFDISMHKRNAPYLGVEPMPLEPFREVFRELLASGSFFVYELAGRVVGFYSAARGTGRTRHAARLGYVAVDPVFDGSPLARNIVTDAIAGLRREGVRRIELAVERDNPRALRFYEQLGFVREGTLRQAFQREGEAPVDQLLLALLLQG